MGARSAIGLCLVLLGTGCAARTPGPPAAAEIAHPPLARPDGCRSVSAGADLDAAIAAVEEGGALCLEPGVYGGPVRLHRRVELFGPREAILRSTGTGTTLSVTADGASVVGITVDGSGHRFDLLDSAIAVEKADGVRIAGVRVENATFGILTNQSSHLVVEDNEVSGNGEPTLGLRGDSIRLWETRASVVRRNHVFAGRDVVVWYSPDNRVEDNVVEGGRYGTHLMYSHRNVLANNRYRGNEVGIFSMYSRDLRVEGNTVTDATGSSGVAFAAKESGNLTVVGNRFVHNTTSIYLDTCPLQDGDRDRFEDNLLSLSETGVLLHNGRKDNAFVRNRFRDTRTQVSVEGGGDALLAEWTENDFDDYAGYDLDGDGIGDVPYRLESLSGQLEDRYPELRFFRGTPALALVEIAGRAVPLFEPKTILVDPRPRMGSLREEVRRAH